MGAAELTAIGALLVSIGGFAKIIFDNRRREKRLEEQLSERRDTRATRLSDIVFERLQAELQRTDAKLQEREKQYAEAQLRIAELEQNRARREVQLQELSARLGQVNGKIDSLATGMFEKFNRGDPLGG